MVQQCRAVLRHRLPADLLRYHRLRHRRHGRGWESHGAPYNKDIISGVTELVKKLSRPHLDVASNARRSYQSNIGIKGVEQIASGLNFVFDLNFGFDPYSFTAANGPISLFDNNGIPLAAQSSNANSSRAGQFYNGVGYAGFARRPTAP